MTDWFAMPVENGHATQLEEIIAALVEEAQGGNAQFAISSLETLVREHGLFLREQDLYTLARLDAFAGTSPENLWTKGPVSTASLDAAVEQALRRRGIWRRFRRRELLRLSLAAAKWGVALLAMAAGLIAAVWLAVVAPSHILRWLGF